MNGNGGLQGRTCGVSGGPRTLPVPAMETWGDAGRQRGGRGRLRGVEAAGPKGLFMLLKGDQGVLRKSCGKHAGAAGPDQTWGKWAWNLIPGLLIGNSTGCGVF